MHSQACVFFYIKQTQEGQEKYNKVVQEIYQFTEAKGSNWNRRGHYTSGESFFFVHFFYRNFTYISTLYKYISGIKGLIQEEMSVSKQTIFEQNYTFIRKQSL